MSVPRPTPASHITVTIERNSVGAARQHAHIDQIVSHYRALKAEHPDVAADLRLDAADEAHTARLEAEGYTKSRCDRCGAVRVLSWRGGECNEYDAQGEDERCGGVFRPVRVGEGAA